MGLFDLNKKLTVGRQNGFVFNQINELFKKIYSNLSYINIHFYPKHRIPILHRHFLKNFLKIMIMIKLIVMIWIILFIMLVLNGIHILIHNVDKKIV